MTPIAIAAAIIICLAVVIIAIRKAFGADTAWKSSGHMNKGPYGRSAALPPGQYTGAKRTDLPVVSLEAGEGSAIDPLPGSKLLPQDAGRPERLQAIGAPILRDTNDVLGWLGIPLRQLLPLANPRNRIIGAKKANYVEWHMPKKRGGHRIICSPKLRLKAIQRRIKTEILDRVALHDAAHGFAFQRNIITNATPHVGQQIVVNMDLRDFFGHVRYPQVFGVFRWLGYGREVSRWLTMLCTHRPTIGVVTSAGDQAWCMAYRELRHAVQGAPTSPVLANLVAMRLDRRLSALARRFNCSYTRYADDLTFSGGDSFKRGLSRFVPLVRRVVNAEKFRLHAKKQRIMRLGQRQVVTGVVVNQRTNVARDEFDRLKAIIHNAVKAGSIESQNRDGRPHFRAYLLGRAAHVRMLNAARGEKLITKIRALP